MEIFRSHMDSVVDYFMNDVKYSELYYYCQIRDVYNISKLLKSETNKSKTYILFKIIQNGYTYIAKLLIENGADINYYMYRDFYTCISKFNVLMYICYYKRTDILKILLNHNVNIELTLKNGNTLLIYASKIGYYECVKLLLDHYISVIMDCEKSISYDENEDIDVTLQTYKNILQQNIHHAKKRHTIKDLLYNFIYHKNKDKSNAFIEACYHGQYKIAKLLLETYNIMNPHNPDNIHLSIVSSCKRNRNTALIMACMGNHLDIVEMIINEYNKLEHKIRYYKPEENLKDYILWRNNRGLNALDISATYGSFDAFTFLLISLNLNCGITNLKQPLLNSIRYGRVDIVKDIITFGQYYCKNDNTRKDNNKFIDIYPLHSAISHNKINVVRELLKMDNCDVNMEDNMRRSPLKIAIYNNNIKIIRELLKHKNISYNDVIMYNKDYNKYKILKYYNKYRFDRIVQILLFILIKNGILPNEMVLYIKDLYKSL